MKNTCIGQSATGGFADPATLFNGLKNLQTAAICYLHKKVSRHLAARKHLAQASSLDAEEMANDAVLLALQKIKSGAYLFQGFSPVTFALVIADNLLRNFCRKKRMNCSALEAVELPLEVEVEAYLTHKELELEIGKALGCLSENCRLLIRLKYFEDLHDEEIVSQQLTPYGNVDSLKSKRCNCMRKLEKLINGSLAF